MKHILKLQPHPFDMIKNGTKIIEVRLFDEKRRAIQIGDTIQFLKDPELAENIQVEVVGLLHYKTFADLLRDFPAPYFGCDTTQEVTDLIYKFYSKEQEKKFTVLGIRIKLL